MAPRGQVLERMTVVPPRSLRGAAGGDDLEGLFQPGVADGAGVPVVLAPPHPRLFGTMDASVLSEIAWSLARADHPTLRFNYRGIGASGGASLLPDLYGRTDPLREDELAPLVEDVAAAVEHLGDTCGAPACAVVGYSLGACAAARVGIEHPRVGSVVLIAPPVQLAPIDFPALAATGMPVLVLCGADDAVAPPGVVQAAAGGAFTVAVVPGANHAFVRGLSELGARVAASVR